MAAFVIQEFRRTLDTGEPFYSHDYIHQRADVKGVESYEWELHRITLPDAEYGVVCYYFDSTELREVQQALRRSQAWLRGQKEAFHASMTGKPLETALDMLVRSAVEHAGGDARASFFLVNPEGTAIRHVAGMSAEYGRVVGDL